MIKFGGYSIGIAQTDNEIEQKLNIRLCPNSTINLLVSRFDMPNMRCFSVDGMKTQHDAILESIGTTEETVVPLTRLPSTTYSFLSSSLLQSKIWTFLFSCSSQTSKLFEVKLRLSRKTLIIEKIPSRIMT